MDVAKIFENGRSQAVRLPKKFRFTGDEVYIKQINGMVVLMPKDDPWQAMLASFDMFTDDYLADGIEALPVQERTEL